MSPDSHNNTAPAALLHSTSTPHERSHRSHNHHKLRSRSHSTRVERCDKQGHHRSRSHDLSKTMPILDSMLDMKYNRLIEQTVEEQEEEEGEQEVKSPEEVSSPKLPQKLTSTPKQHKFRPVSLPPHLPETVSPHHHRRHRHRDRNRKLAMQQVAEWIEREHLSWTCDGDNLGSRTIVQRHEHHHLHEHHHHHHYHHYHET